MNSCFTKIPNDIVRFQIIPHLTIHEIIKLFNQAIASKDTDFIDSILIPACIIKTKNTLLYENYIKDIIIYIIKKKNINYIFNFLTIIKFPQLCKIINYNDYIDAFLERNDIDLYYNIIHKCDCCYYYVISRSIINDDLDSYIYYSFNYIELFHIMIAIEHKSINILNYIIYIIHKIYKNKNSIIDELYYNKYIIDNYQHDNIDLNNMLYTSMNNISNKIKIDINDHHSKRDPQINKYLKKFTKIFNFDIKKLLKLFIQYKYNYNNYYYYYDYDE